MQMRMQRRKSIKVFRPFSCMYLGLVSLRGGGFVLQIVLVGSGGAVHVGGWRRLVGVLVQEVDVLGHGITNN